MKLEGRYSFRKGRREVWSALQDPQTLAATLPGVRRLEVVSPDRFLLAADVGVGSVKGRFEGTFSIEDKAEPETCVLRGSARGPAGAADVDAKVRLAESDGGGTLLEYEANTTVSGAIAGVGQRMVSAAASRMASQFFDAVDRYDPSMVAEPAGAPAEAGRVFERPPAPGRDMRTFVAGVATGFVLALVGVVVGRWSARR